MNKLFPTSLTLILWLFSSLYAQHSTGPENANSKRRVALVIGNGAYVIAPLRNPVNDAQDMAQALRGLGFEVIYRENLNQSEIKRVIRTFGEKLRGGGVGLFYYAGHGVQVKGVNYLVPVDAVVESEEEIEYECVDAGFALAQMESAGNSLNIMILDACRNNPFARSFRRSVSQGLAQMDAPSGTLIAYATAPGSVASDGDARNGIYTQELLRFMRMPNVGIEEVFKRVRISVRNLTKRKQTPWESSSLTGDFYFTRATSNSSIGTSTGVTVTNPTATTSDKSDVPSLAGTTWVFTHIRSKTHYTTRCEFLSDGSVTVHAPNGSILKKRWKQDGEAITIEERGGGPFFINSPPPERLVGRLTGKGMEGSIYRGYRDGKQEIMGSWTAIKINPR